VNTIFTFFVVVDTFVNHIDLIDRQRMCLFFF